MLNKALNSVLEESGLSRCIWDAEHTGSNPVHATKTNNMKIIKLIITLLVSIITQILLFPLRVVQFIFNFFEKLFYILKNTTTHLIKQIEEVVIKK